MRDVKDMVQRCRTCAQDVELRSDMYMGGVAFVWERERISNEDIVR